MKSARRIERVGYAEGGMRGQLEPNALGPEFVMRISSGAGYGYNAPNYAHYKKLEFAGYISRVGASTLRVE
jgi:hypothetical protein